MNEVWNPVPGPSCGEVGGGIQPGAPPALAQKASVPSAGVSGRSAHRQGGRPRGLRGEDGILAGRGSGHLRNPAQDATVAFTLVPWLSVLLLQFKFRLRERDLWWKDRGFPENSRQPPTLRQCCL